MVNVGFGLATWLDPLFGYVLLGLTALGSRSINSICNLVCWVLVFSWLVFAGAFWIDWLVAFICCLLGLGV